jgi:hypothetical protein
MLAFQRSASASLLAILCAAVAAAGQAPGEFQGRPVAKAGELVGSWMRATPGNWLGVEFLKNDSVMVTQDVAGPLGRLTSTFTFKYAVLDGGRVSFVAPNGATTVFQAKASGDLLELAVPSEGIQILGVELSFGGSQRFRRLPSGKTLSQALEEEAARFAAEREKRTAAIRQLVQGGSLVLVPERGGAGGPVVVLRFEASPGAALQGLAVVEAHPERPDFIDPIRVHPIVATIEPEEIPFGDSGRVVVTIAAARAVEPPNQRHVDGRIQLVAEGPADRPAIRGTVEFPARRESWSGIVLKSDPALHAATLARLETQREAVRKKLAAVAGPLGGKAILTGFKSLPGAAQPQPVELTLERVQGSEAFTANAAIAAARTSGVAAPDLVIDRPVLHVVLSSGEEWRLEPSDDGKRFAGPLQPYPGAGFLGQGSVELALTRSWTLERLAAIAAAIERFVAVDLQQPVELAGRGRKPGGPALRGKGRGSCRPRWRSPPGVP